MSGLRPLSQNTQDEIATALSSVRLRPYLRTVNGQLEPAIRLYELNLCICTAIYPSLHIFEITFRNQIDRALQEQYGRHWYQCGLLEQRAQSFIEKAKDTVRRQGRPLTRPRIISELTLGFWISLITRKKYQQRVFNKCIKYIFPYALATERNFKELAPKLPLNILYLRNRVFHYEPIWQKPYDVSSKHQYIHKTLNWISPEVLQWLKTQDDFLKVYNQVSDELEHLINPFRYD
ncbi:hypothetical protein [Sodalinema gerasimenkoae]|uniref:hypothetical protein n=1 Tax=Sodalinema gerasimenkoae TaxID=2862348 RepID=UPI001356E173|nr:hypothetical protein [Sodalinema gerasimenkoae]